MGIVNAGALPLYDEIKPQLRELCETVVLNKSSKGTEDLLDYAQKLKQTKSSLGSTAELDAWRKEDVEHRLRHALIKVISQRQ
jgi:5-methyltetrahydrofolate--homocysteine methyltransferase